MTILDEYARNVVLKRLKDMKSTVTLVYFEKKTQLNDQIKSLLSEITSLSDKVKIEIYDLERDKTAAAQYDVTTGPVIIFKSENVKGDARFYGMPSGFEFATFLEVLKMAGGELMVDNKVKEFFDLSDGVKLEVFVTPTCPHCPASAYVALKFAMVSSRVKGYVYEAMEFPEIASKYRVMSVPKTIVNDGRGEYVGGYPEDIAFIKIKSILEG